MRPTTLPRSFAMPAMSRSDPFGFTPRSGTRPGPRPRADRAPTPRRCSRRRAFFSGMTISWPSAKSDVHGGRRVLDARRWSRRTKCWWALRISPPGSRWASTSIWKPLQMPRTGHALGGGILHLGHDRRERGDRARAQVVAVAEAARQHEGVDALAGRAIAVPQRDRLGAGDADGALRVAVVERAGEGDDADARRSRRRPRCRRRLRSRSWRGSRRRSRSTVGAAPRRRPRRRPSSSKRLPMRTDGEVLDAESRERARRRPFPAGPAARPWA